ncbi:putative ubiquitin associated and SH3 domain-containing protein B, partial [Ixodes scapularis]
STEASNPERVAQREHEMNPRTGKQRSVMMADPGPRLSKAALLPGDRAHAHAGAERRERKSAGKRSTTAHASPSREMRRLHFKFKAPDDGIAHLTRALQHVVDKLKGELPDHIKLEHYTSQTFLGLFVAEEHNDVLKKLAVQFMREVSEFSIQVEPYLKALHITLAYQFQLEHYSVLEQLSQSIDTSASACWELRLYSRDTRIKGSEVHKVLYSHVPKEPDELELLIGDFVYVSGEHLGAATDGWVEGTSWLTGSTGFLPKNYIERTAESDAWTLHRSITIAKNVFLDGLDNVVIQRRVLGASQAPPSPQLSPKPQPAEREDRGAAAAKENIYENLGFLAQKASLGRTP